MTSPVLQDDKNTYGQLDRTFQENETPEPASWIGHATNYRICEGLDVKSVDGMRYGKDAIVRVVAKKIYDDRDWYMKNEEPLFHPIHVHLEYFKSCRDRRQWVQGSFSDS